MTEQFTFTPDDLEDVKNEIEEVVWCFVRWDLAEALIATGEYCRKVDVNENTPTNFTPLQKAPV